MTVGLYTLRPPPSAFFPFISISGSSSTMLLRCLDNSSNLNQRYPTSIYLLTTWSYFFPSSFSLGSSTRSCVGILYHARRLHSSRYHMPLVLLDLCLPICQDEIHYHTPSPRAGRSNATRRPLPH